MTVLLCKGPRCPVKLRPEPKPDQGCEPGTQRITDPVVAGRRTQTSPDHDTVQEVGCDVVASLLETFEVRLDALLRRVWCLRLL